MMEWPLLLMMLPYILLMWLFARGLYKLEARKKSRELSGSLPAVSVVVAARNEAQNIRPLLVTLQNQVTHPVALEVILVDDHSEDETVSLAESFQMPFPFQVIRASEAGFTPGKKGALEGGIHLARHPLVLVTDADTIPTAHWTEEVRYLFGDREIQFAAGYVSYSEGMGFTNALESLDFYGLVGSGAGAAGMGYPFMCNAANMAFRREAYEEVKAIAFNSHRTSGDDVFLLHKMVERFGRKHVGWYQTDGSIVQTNPTGSFKEYFKQRVRWASKGGSYTHSIAIITGVIVLFTNALIVTSYLMVMANVFMLWIPLALTAIKLVADFPLLWMMTCKFKQQRLLRWLIPVGMVYPWVTLMAGVASFVWRPYWKGRRIR